MVRRRNKDSWNRQSLQITTSNNSASPTSAAAPGLPGAGNPPSSGPALLQASSVCSDLCTRIADASDDDHPMNPTPDRAISPVPGPIGDEEGWESDISKGEIRWLAQSSPSHWDPMGYIPEAVDNFVHSFGVDPYEDCP